MEISIELNDEAAQKIESSSSLLYKYILFTGLIQRSISVPHPRGLAQSRSVAQKTPRARRRQWVGQ